VASHESVASTDTSSLRLRFDRDPTYVALVLDFMQYGEHQSLQSFRPPAATTAPPPPSFLSPQAGPAHVMVAEGALANDGDDSTSVDDLRNAIAATVEVEASPVKAPPPPEPASPPATRVRVPKISFGGVAVDQVSTSRGSTPAAVESEGCVSVLLFAVMILQKAY
jgi:hypothetical protein